MFSPARTHADPNSKRIIAVMFDRTFILIPAIEHYSLAVSKVLLCQKIGAQSSAFIRFLSCVMNDAPVTVKGGQ